MSVYYSIDQWASEGKDVLEFPFTKERLDHWKSALFAFTVFEHRGFKSVARGLEIDIVQKIIRVAIERNEL